MPKNIGISNINYNYKQPLLNRSEITNNYVFESKSISKPKKETPKRSFDLNNNNYIYNINNKKKTSIEEKTTKIDYKLEPLFKPKELSTEPNIKNNNDIKSKYLSDVKIINIKKFDDEPIIKSIYDSKAKNIINQSNDLNKIKNYVMMPKKISVLNERKNKNVYEYKQNKLSDIKTNINVENNHKISNISIEEKIKNILDYKPTYLNTTKTQSRITNITKITNGTKPKKIQKKAKDSNQSHGGQK